MPKLKDIEIEKIEGEEKIWNRNLQKPGGKNYVPAKHTYLKCNACGKHFSLNYKDKKFEEAKLLALNAKWKHADKENHHQEEIIYFGEEEVGDSTS